MKRSMLQSYQNRGFTLIELLCVIAVIAILASILMPVVQNTTVKAYDTKCMNNLRQIGMAANSAANDNDNIYPIVEIDPASGSMVSDTLGVPAKPIDQALAPYGITAVNLQCPADLKGPNYYAQNTPHTSYMWAPYPEDNSENAPFIVSRRRGNLMMQVPPSHLQLCTDWSAVHYISDGNIGAGKMIYVVYGDGHVRTSRKPTKH
jgi:prepilin-type N-terminal cleavage/methylation domain-containing protein